MGRMTFHIIPRDGKTGIWLGKAAIYDRSDTGRYELYITDYAEDVCEGETQTARRGYCADATALLNALAEHPVLALPADFRLGELERAMADNISDIFEFRDLCGQAEVVFEELPLLIEKFDY